MAQANITAFFEFPHEEWEFSNYLTFLLKKVLPPLRQHFKKNATSEIQSVPLSAGDKFQKLVPPGRQAQIAFRVPRHVHPEGGGC